MGSAKQLNPFHTVALILLSRWRKGKNYKAKVFVFISLIIPVLIGFLVVWNEAIGKPGCYWIGTDEFAIAPWRVANIHCESVWSYLERLR
eukprot:4015955-Pyramimonas_sp.AAC.1